MDISDVAQHAGLPASTLRFYEEKGLISASGRHGLRRQYNADVLERLALITLGRASGFSLDEIAQVLGSGKRPEIDRQLLADKAEELDRSITKLTTMRNGLRHAAVCAAPSHMECPTFRRLLGLAAAGALTEPVSGKLSGKLSGKVNSRKASSTKVSRKVQV